MQSDIRTSLRTDLFAHTQSVSKLPLFFMGAALGNQVLHSGLNESPSVKIAGGSAAPFPSSTHANGLALAVLLFSAALISADLLGLFGEYPDYMTGSVKVRLPCELVAPLFQSALLYALTCSPDALAARLLRWRPLLVLGDWSFAIYALQWPVLSLYVWLRLGTERWLISRPMASIGSPVLEHFDTPVVALIVILLGGVVFNFYETPARRWVQGLESTNRATKAASLM